VQCTQTSNYRTPLDDAVGLRRDGWDECVNVRLASGPNAEKTNPKEKAAYVTTMADEFEKAAPTRDSMSVVMPE
jgi:hypothetical protein